MAIRRHHVIFTGVWLAIAAQLGFAAAFYVDAANTNDVYYDIAAHHVELRGALVGCGYTGRYSTIPICRLGYRYDGRYYTRVVPGYESRTLYVDTKNPAWSMNAVSYQIGPRAIAGDLAIGTAFLLGALLVFGLHLLHLHVRRRQVHYAGHAHASTSYLP